jgi:hypothetical protein
MATSARVVAPVVASLFLPVFALHASAATKVDCAKGESINAALAKLPKTRPQTLTVSGTCAEDILIVGFDDLALLAAPDAVLTNLSDASTAVIRIEASRRISISGFRITITGGAQAVDLWDCVACDLTRLTVTGGGGIRYERNSSGEVTASTVTNARVAILAGQASTVNLRDSLLDNTGFTPPRFGSGIITFDATVFVEGTSIRGFGNGALVSSGALSLVSGNILPNPDPVTFESNGVGIQVGRRGSVTFGGGTAVTITGNGTGGDFSGGIVVDGGFLSNNAGASVSIADNNGQGVIAFNHAVVELIGGNVSIAQNRLNGIVAVNASIIEFRNGPPVSAPTKVTVTSNGAQDLFCDSDSQLRGFNAVVGASRVTCTNALPGRSVPLPRP